MPPTNTARQIELPSADDLVESPGFKAAQDFANSRAMEILREWANTPEIKAILEEAERQKKDEAA